MNAYLIPLLLIAIGGALIASGTRLSEYYDPNWKSTFEKSGWQTRRDQAVDGRKIEALDNEWMAAQAKALTPRDARLDAGTGLIALGASLAIAFAGNGVRRLRDLADLTTPKTKYRFYELATMAWLSFIPSTWIWFYYLATHRDAEPDTDASIAASLYAIVMVVGLPVWLIISSGAIGRANLPVRIWSRPALGSYAGWSLLLWIATILWIAGTIRDVWWEPGVVPSDVFILYILLSERAASASRQSNHLPSSAAPA